MQGARDGYEHQQGQGGRKPRAATRGHVIANKGVVGYHTTGARRTAHRRRVHLLLMVQLGTVNM